MTITNTTRSATGTGNGATTSWPYTFIIPDAASANVKLLEIATGIETELATNLWSIAGLNDPAGGTVTYPLSGSPLASTHQIIIYREVAATQTVTITNQTKYYAGVVMGVWDRLTMMIQEVKDDVFRSLRTPVGEGTLGVLPTIIERASAFLAFDAQGDPIASSGTPGTVPVTAFMETLLDDANAATARATLGAVIGTDVQAYDAALDAVTGVNTGDEVAASTTVSGIVEKATAAEMTAGTADKYPDALTIKAAAGPAREEEVDLTGLTEGGFTTLPANANRVTMTGSFIQLSGTDNILIQFGDNGGYEITGYKSGCSSNGSVPTTSTAGFIMSRNSTTTNVFDFVATFVRHKGNRWILAGTNYSATGPTAYVSGGQFATSEMPDRIRCKTSGSNTFLAGEINIQWAQGHIL